jgi:Zn finger protein HypA/HybF involved in hydrogenase expression
MYICSKVETMATKRTKADYENAARTSQSIAGMCRVLGLKPCGGNYRQMHKAIIEFQIDVSHFTGQGWNVGLKFRPKATKPLEEILVKDSNYQSFKLKNRLFNEGVKERRCECCGNDEWLGQPIPLELHHIDGDNTNNELENLQILCPNCHAMTTTYRGLNRVHTS